MMINARGQFYIIASVFVFISLAALFVFTIFVDFGTLTLPTQSTDFENLQNAISQRNSWLSTYWYDLNCKNKTVADISPGYTNPVEFDAGIPPCVNSIYVFKLSGTTRTQITPAYLSTSGCNVTFNATDSGLYEVYWNCPFTGPWPTLDGNEISPSTYLAEVPAEGICSHFSNLLPRKNIAFSCSATTGTNTYNYSIGFRATDFAYNGSLA